MRIKKHGLWYDTALCPSCQNPREVREKEIKDGVTKRRCASCAAKGNQRRGTGWTKVIGCVRRINDRFVIRLKEGHGEGCWRTIKIQDVRELEAGTISASALIAKLLDLSPRN